jgi:outer membrane receptor protein involved in Fe transport
VLDEPGGIGGLADGERGAVLDDEEAVPKAVVKFVGDAAAFAFLGFDELVGDGPAPRIPAWRVLGGLEAQSDRIQARAEVEWVDSQKRITDFETPTDGYTMVNASIAFQPIAGNPNTSIVLSANNIFDVTARRHASFLKDFAPLAGRDIRISGRINF